MYQYPYGNAQQLNLDWILSKLQELESGSGGGADLEEVANALVSASFDATIPYRKYDYAFYDGKLYRALNDNIGVFNPSDWMEVTLGTDIPVLTRLVNADSALITTLQNQLQNLGSDEVANESTVTGTTVSDALGNLNGAISDCISANVDAATTIPNGTDYDTLTTVGNYVCSSGSAAQTMTNQPSAAAHRLYVIQNAASNRITQIALINSDTAKLMLRTLTSSGWSSWTEPSYRVQSQLTSNVEEDNTATQSYSVGDFLAINADLYRVTSSIANGGTISTSTNVSATTVTDELKSLSSGVATRIEVQNLNVPKNTTGKHISASEKRMLLLFAYGTSADRCGLYIARLSPTAESSQIVPVLAVTASNVTIEATSTGVQVINNNVASNDYILAAVDGKSIDSLTIT